MHRLRTKMKHKGRVRFRSGRHYIQAGCISLFGYCLDILCKRTTSLLNTGADPGISERGGGGFVHYQ